MVLLDSNMVTCQAKSREIRPPVAVRHSSWNQHHSTLDLYCDSQSSAKMVWPLAELGPSPPPCHIIRGDTSSRFSSPFRLFPFTTTSPFQAPPTNTIHSQPTHDKRHPTPNTQNPRLPPPTSCHHQPTIPFRKMGNEVGLYTSSWGCLGT